MKGNEQNLGATAFDYPNDQNPRPILPMFYGNQLVPHPTNSAAKITHPFEVMREVMEAK